MLQEASEGCPHHLRGERGPAGATSSDPGLQDCERIHFRGIFQPLVLRSFETAAPGN